MKLGIFLRVLGMTAGPPSHPEVQPFGMFPDFYFVYVYRPPARTIDLAATSERPLSAQLGRPLANAANVCFPPILLKNNVLRSQQLPPE